MPESLLLRGFFLICLLLLVCATGLLALWNQGAWQVLGWVTCSLVMALAIAAQIVAYVTRPLRTLAHAAHRVGSQQEIRSLPVEGPRELRQVMEAFNRMSADLHEQQREQLEVLAGISHDLRTPLTRLRLEAEMSIPDDLAREAVVADIEQMDGILTQFFDYARGNDPETSEDCHLSNELRLIAAHAEALGKPLTLHIAPDCADLHTHLPIKALHRALQNLVENAWKYGLDDKGGRWVTVSLERTTDSLVFSVSDQGPGIPEESTEHLKRAFSRLNTARSNASGSGLGLAIVDRFARRQGGHLHLANQPGGGLCARIEIPCS